MKNIKIAAGSGFWGDWEQAAINQVRLGEINYLVLDYLAELTMSVLAKQYEKNNQHGYAYDFNSMLSNILSDIADKNIKVISNAGGMNPRACAEEIQKQIKLNKLSRPLKIAIVTGDNLTAEIPSLVQQGQKISNLDDGSDIQKVASKIVSANAYLGAQTIVKALELGADIIITGRVSDAALALAPMIFEFNWSASDWDCLALGTVAGHIIECGAQASGGNCSFDWQQIPDLANIGYPIISINENLDCIIYKHPNTGGRINLATIKEQLVYEIGDPENYITPDVIADFTSVQLKDLANDRVQISGVKGKPASDKYKLSIAYTNGFRSENSLIYSAPDAILKAQAAESIFRERTKHLNLTEVRVEHIGLNSCHGNMAKPNNEVNEIMLRVAARGDDKEELKKFSRALTPLVLSGPPSVSGYTSGGKVNEVYSFWPALVPKALIDPNIKVELI